MCVSPITIVFRGETRRTREACGLPTSIVVPCGTCSECAKKKSVSWGVRAYRESLFAPANSVRFVTITYDDDNIPLTPKGNNTLDSAHCKRFLKSLRQSLFRKYGVVIRFMLSAEYGSRTFRPHYHFLFFGIPSHLTNVELRRIIASAWHKCSVIDVQFPKNGSSSGFYVGKYMAKSGYNRARAIHADDLDFVMPFKRASIGFGNQFTKSEIAYYLALDVPEDRPIPGYTPPSIEVSTYKMASLFNDSISVESDYDFVPSLYSGPEKPKPPFPSAAVSPATAKSWHESFSVSEAQRWLDLFGKNPRFLEIVRRYHQCHRPLKDGSYTNMDFPEYLAIKLYGKDLYKDIRRCIHFAMNRAEELQCDAASAFLEPDSFAAKNFDTWYKYYTAPNPRKDFRLDFDSWLIFEYHRFTRRIFAASPPLS